MASGRPGGSGLLTVSLPEAALCLVAFTTVVKPDSTVWEVPAARHTYTRWCTWWLSLRGGKGRASVAL